MNSFDTSGIVEPAIDAEIKTEKKKYIRLLQRSGKEVYLDGSWAEMFQEQILAWQRDTPLERLGTVEDMGGLAIFLCSRAGAFINGRTIVTDGGRTL